MKAGKHFSFLRFMSPSKMTDEERVEYIDAFNEATKKAAFSIEELGSIKLPTTR